MVFKGRGAVKAKEEGGYHPDVHVYFQENAFVDLPVLLEDVESRLKPYFAERFPDGDSTHIHFLDNMKAQKKTEYVAKLRAVVKGKSAYGPAYLTHAWAPLDRGHLNAVLKALAKEKFAKWMEQPSASDPNISNWKKWEDNKYTASEKRVLSTWMFGESCAFFFIFLFPCLFFVFVIFYFYVSCFLF